MKFDKEFFIRAGLILFGLIIIFFGVYSIYQEINPTIQNVVETQSLDFNQLQNIDYSIWIYLIIIGFIIYFVGRHWKESFKNITKILVSFAVIFLTVSIIFFVTNSNSQKLADSIQPSLDTLIMGSIEVGLNSMIENSIGEKINLLLSKNVTTKIMYVKNLSLENANLITKNLELTNLNSEEKIIFTKFFISTTYDEILKSNPQMIGLPIPIATLKEESAKQGVDISIINTIDINLLNSIPNNQEAYLNILLSENDVKKELIIGKISKEDINLIWNNLGFNNNVSLNTKSLTTNLILGQYKTQTKDNLKLNNIAIPITTLGSIFPKEIKNIFNYDFLSENLTKRTEVLIYLRQNCKENSNLESNEILMQLCEFVSYSEYEYLMQNLGILIEENNISIGNSTLKTIEKFNTIEKVKKNIEEKSNWSKWFGIYILFIILAFASYFTHFKINKDENETLPKFHMPYYITKLNLIQIVPSTIIVYLFYYLLKEEIIFNFLTENLSSEIAASLEIVKSLPIYILILEITNQMIHLIFIYLIFSLIIFGIFYYLLKKEVEE